MHTCHVRIIIWIRKNTKTALLDNLCTSSIMLSAETIYICHHGVLKCFYLQQMSYFKMVLSVLQYEEVFFIISCLWGLIIFFKISDRSWINKDWKKESAFVCLFIYSLSSGYTCLRYLILVILKTTELKEKLRFTSLSFKARLSNRPRRYLISVVIFCFQYFVFDFHMAPAMLFDRIITLTVSCCLIMERKKTVLIYHDICPGIQGGCV